MKNHFSLKHPKGLYLLFTVEMWERFSYYGMRALLVLYMVQFLQFSTEKAGTIYGIYTGLVYLTPLLGGYLADRYLGQRKCVTYGALLMCIGLFCLGINSLAFFYGALFLMILGNGFFKANISTILGKLYGKNKSRRDSGFTIFYMGINLGAFFSPFICGTLAIKYGFKYGFIAAGIGMVLGLVIYKLNEKKLLKAHGLEPYKPILSDNGVAQNNLTQQEKNQILALFILMFFSIFFWVAYEQAGSSMTLFAEYSTNRFIGNFEIPASWFQSLNPLYIIIFAPLISIFWSFLGKYKKEPTTITKFASALILISFGFLVMSLAAQNAMITNVAIYWLFVVYFIQTIAELCISPVGLSLVSKLAPVKFASLLMGTWFFASFFGNLMAGLFAGQYDAIEHHTFFAILAILTLLASLLLLLLKNQLSKWIKE